MGKSSRTVTLPSAMEPLKLQWEGTELEDLAIELVRETSALYSLVAPGTRDALAKLVRSMNAYYSNLIEGQHTLPIDIDRAMSAPPAASNKTRDLQALAKAHIEVETELEHIVRSDELTPITSTDFLCDIHRRFYSRLPDDFRWIYSRSGERLRVEPGELRKHHVEVGQHLPPSPESLPLLMTAFCEAYDDRRSTGIGAIIAAMASHHRLAWIHPFLDGNGRVTRLFSQCMLMRAGLDSHGLWTLSRGLARTRDRYLEKLSNADSQRLNDLDGRGNLSERGLREFTKYMLEVSIDQAKYMSSLFAFDGVLMRIKRFVDLMVVEGKLHRSAQYVLEPAYLKGEVARAEVHRLTGVEERTSRHITSQMVKLGILTAETHRAPLKINFPPSIAPYLFPHLFPGDVETQIAE